MLAKSSLRCGIARLKNVSFLPFHPRAFHITLYTNFFKLLKNTINNSIISIKRSGKFCTDRGAIERKSAAYGTIREHFERLRNEELGKNLHFPSSRAQSQGQLAIGLAFIFMAPASLFFKRGLTTPSKTKTRFPFFHPRACNFIKKPHVLNTSTNNQGQLAIGLAFIFMAFLALFSMVFQSSMLVREKIKLQQSVDYAALTGAQIQRAALDKIHQINDNILQNFYATQAALLPSYFSAFSMQDSSTVKTSVSAITGDASALASCTSANQAYDKFIRKQIIRRYEMYRSQQVELIMDIIENTNSLTHEYVIQQIIHTPNLPQRLRHKIIKAMGQDPNIASLQASYDNGLLYDHLRITSSGDMDLPLFIPSSLNPANDMTSFVYPKYTSLEASGPLGGAPVCYVPIPSGPMASPTQTIVGRHPASDKSWPSHFAVIALYNPPSSTVEGKFNLKVKNPNAADEENVSLAGGEDIDLMPTFDSQSPRRWPMLVASLAKPFGGKFPRAPLQALPHGNPGELFAGAKLIGFADYQQQLEGHTPLIPLLQEIADKYGITVEWDEVWH